MSRQHGQQLQRLALGFATVREHTIVMFDAQGPERTHAQQPRPVFDALAGWHQAPLAHHGAQELDILARLQPDLGTSRDQP
jgi:hypothetical protein